MGKTKSEPDNYPDPSTLQRIEAQVLEKVHSGYTAPCGWLFRGLSFFFSNPGLEVSNGKESTSAGNDLGLKLIQNTACFAGASCIDSFDDPKITHVIVNTEVAASTEIASLRKSLAARPGRKVPHLVTSKWVEESWKNRTLLDEESELLLPGL